MNRRIFGLETEFGILHHHPDNAGLTAEELARYLFRPVIAWGRSSNVFVENGSRLYLDVGSHPEYATAECSDPFQATLYDKAGERVVAALARSASAELEREGVAGTVHVFKNNEDSAGHSYGCHENYLLRRSGNFTAVTNQLIPFLVTRSIVIGSGGLIHSSTGSQFVFSPRAEHLEEATSSATTRSRPMINTRDEPHADAQEYRRLHVISGDSSMAESSSIVKLGMMDLVLRVLESGKFFRDFTINRPAEVLRSASRDLTGSQLLDIDDGRSWTAVSVQRYFLAEVRRQLKEFTDRDEWVMAMWERAIDAVETGNPALVGEDLDWAIKWQLFSRYRDRNSGVPWSDPRLRTLDLLYHEITGEAPLFATLQQQGLVRRHFTEADIAHAEQHPPQSTRAVLRGAFITAASRARRDYTVDWVHLKLNEPGGRTVLLKDPFTTSDERVDTLIAQINQTNGPEIVV